MFAISFVYAVKYLSTKELKYDLYAKEMVSVGIMFGMLGIFSGMVWANFTWGGNLGAMILNKMRRPLRY